MNDYLEIKSKRKEREKHFLKPDGTILAQLYPENIHYLKDGIYEEIDNTLIKDENGYHNAKNDFQVFFHQKEIELKKGSNFLFINLQNFNLENPIVSKEEVLYQTNEFDLKYNIHANKLKETILLKDKNHIPNLQFEIKTNCKLEKNGEKLLAKASGKTIFNLETPYMKDAEGNENYSISYSLKEDNEKYQVALLFNRIWLESCHFPVTIDPTITDSTSDDIVYDTFIYEGDDGADKNSLDKLVMGVKHTNNQDITCRTLIKFELPYISTGSQILNASLDLIGYPDTRAHASLLGYKSKSIVDVHRVIKDWKEEDANWELMNQEYDSKVEDSNYIYYSPMISGGEITELKHNYFDITSLVKRWYSGTPNYGVLLKADKEFYEEGYFESICFSKNNTLEGYNPKPLLTITYKNYNGLENYMSYQTQVFTDLKGSINYFTGNLTCDFLLGSALGSKFPITLEAFYNTNDVLLNQNLGYGKGITLNYHQILKEVSLESQNLLEYHDGDGTIHYFYLGSYFNNFINDETKKKEKSTYYDEDGLSLSITKEDNHYIMKTSSNEKYYFTNFGNDWYLTEIQNRNGNKVSIQYENNQIVKITDGNMEEVTLSYSDNAIKIVTPTETNTLTLKDGNVVSFQTTNGTTSITYNDLGLISKIIDPSKKGIQYEYYDTIPNRLKKVTELGLNNQIGEFLTITYGNQVTNVIDKQNHVQTYSFNTSGIVTHTSAFEREDSLSTAYGKIYQYGESPFGDSSGNFNKPTEINSLVKTIYNYIPNSSFEEDENIPFLDGNEVSSETSYSGDKSLKITKEGTYSVALEKGNDYTFSTFIKNTSSTELALSYLNAKNEKVEVISDEILKSEEFFKEQVTIFYPNDATSNLTITIRLKETGIAYIDDVQLEVGKVANAHNFIYDSDFRNGINWNITSNTIMEYEENDPMKKHITIPKKEIITLPDNIKALKIKGDPYVSDLFSKTIQLSGKKGDVYELYFWIKNDGIPTVLFPTNARSCWIRFNYKDSVPTDIEPKEMVLSNDNEWKLYRVLVGAEKDYSCFTIYLYNNSSANNLYVTNFTLLKHIGNTSFEYDENGNLIKSFNEVEENQFYYDKKNQLISMTNQKGTHFSYEYDKEKNHLLSAISTIGISNQTIYDENDNPIITRVQNVGKELEEKDYFIRLKGTQKYFSIDIFSKTLVLEEDSCSHDVFHLIKTNEGYFLQSNFLFSYYLTNQNQNPVFTSNSSNLTILKKQNGSYQITCNDEILKVKDGTLLFTTEEDLEDEFYFEKKENNLFIENSATYTSDGKFLTSTTDSLFHTTNYEVNEKGLTTSIVDPNGNATSYTYNSKDQVAQIQKGQKQIKYSYNDSDYLSQIKNENEEYSFTYDDFLNVKSVKIGNQTLITNEYGEHNGNLLSSTYGNKDSISYEYDDYDRLVKTNKMDDTYQYHYDNLGNLSRIDAKEHKYRYDYDSKTRLLQTKYDNFRIKYGYLDNYVSDKFYNFDSYLKQIHYDYNEEDMIQKLTFDNHTLEYQYDELGRLTRTNLNNQYPTTYSYITNGNRTSFLLKDYNLNQDNYHFIYDKLNNITHIYLNDTLVNEYSYDSENELTCEIDYEENTKTLYTYDNNGNLLTKKKYDLEDVLLEENTYSYQNNNWKDQLTQFNDITFTYDEIGNPLTIGNDTLTWTNGRQLKSYQKEDLNITYSYNKDGVRTSKKINDVETSYYVEGNHILLEKTNDDVLYYIRDDSGNLIGFQYEDSTYYYEKNAQNDIIGILNANLERIVSYKYDAWGNLLEVRDSDNQTITDTNSIAFINPFRYRSYYYDKETNLYYLNSRYYSPILGRFINADNYISTDTGILGYNMYAYCNNNPVMYADKNGHGIITLIATLFLSTVFSIFYKNTIHQRLEAKKEIEEYQHKEVADTTQILNEKLHKSAKEIKKIPDVLGFIGQVKNDGEFNLKRTEEWGSLSNSVGETKNE